MSDDAHRSLSVAGGPCAKKLLAFFRTAGPALTFLCLASTQSGCWEGTTREVAATLLAIENSAASSSNIRGKSAPLAPGAELGDGAIISVGGASRAAIALLPNLLVQLEGNTRVEILRLAITKNGNESGAAVLARQADLKMMRGRIFVSHSWGEAVARFTLLTPHGELITTANSLFCVELEESKTRVTCVSGSLGWRRREAEATTRIAPGFVVELSEGDSSTAAADGDARGQETVQQSLELEEKLRFLISQKRHLLPR